MTTTAHLEKMSIPGSSSRDHSNQAMSINRPIRRESEFFEVPFLKSGLMREVCDIMTFDEIKSLIGKSRRKPIQNVPFDVIALLTPEEPLLFDANTHGTL
jgi:hypothetical protein